MSAYGFGDTSLVVEASRRLARQHNPSANQSLPLTTMSGTSISGSAGNGDSITAKYIFPQSKDELPFLVKIPISNSPITLGDVKRHLPKKGIYRFFFKTDMDGEEVLQVRKSFNFTKKNIITYICFFGEIKTKFIIFFP